MPAFTLKVKLIILIDLQIKVTFLLQIQNENKNFFMKTISISNSRVTNLENLFSVNVCYLLTIILLLNIK